MTLWRVSKALWRQKAATRFQRYLDVSMTSPDEPRYTAEGLVRAAENAEACGAEMDADANARYVAALVRLASKQTSPRKAGSYELRYLESVKVDDHEEAGIALRLRLEQASFYARQNKGADRRGAELEAARRLRLPDRTRVEVLVLCAQYRVDIGEYQTARKMLAECDRIVRANPDCGRLLPEIVVCYGGLHFAQGNLRKARRCFERARSLMTERHRDSSEYPMVKAYHYLGKIDALFGRYDRAATLLAHAEALVKRRRTEDPRQSGYNHSRLGGVLRRAASPDHEARWHLELAQKLFRKAGERGSGQGLHAGSVATPNQRGRANELDFRMSLYKSMVERARANSHGRGVVIGSVLLTWIAVRRRDWRQAVRGVLTALNAGFRLALASGILPSATGMLQLLTALSIRKVRDARTALLRRPPLRCPCGASHTPEKPVRPGD